MSIKEIDPAKVEIRIMNDGDLEAITAIDRMYFGTDRPEYYKEKLEAATKGGGINASLVAVVDGTLVGFIMGQLYTGEFGIPQTTANLDTIGVHPMAAGKGIANRLLEQFCAQMAKLGVTTLHTLVDWSDKNLILFFHRSGFVPSKRLSLELSL
ncbi:MAG: GNAT family N-acetyltransferase [Deltaproteobacteria bacterium]|nr:GNAT family N-acetyltransferase [Deltaproteobacteria bacterium]